MAKTLDAETTARLIDQYIERCLQEFERELVEGYTGDPEDLSIVYGTIAEDCAEELQDERYGRVLEDAGRLLEREGIRLDESSVEHRAFLRALLAATQKTAKISSKRMLGDYLWEQTVLGRPSQRVQTTDNQRPTLMLSDGIKKYLEARTSQKKLSKAMVDQYRAAVGDFIEWHGDMPVAAIKGEHVRELRGVYAKLPSKRKTRRETRGLSMRDILGGGFEGVPLLQSQTIANSINVLSTIFAWFVKEGFMDRNPAEGEAPSKESQGYLAWSPEELRKIFAHDWFTSGSPSQAWNFWIPLLALYGGQRLGEIAQLRVDDVRQEDGVVFLQITDEQEGKRLKTKAARRRVPVHSDLLGLGFMDYVERRRRAGHESLWTIPKPAPSASWSKYPSKRFTYLFRSCGVAAANTKVFHSFRKVAVTGLLNSGVPERLVAELVGHEHGSITVDTYHAGSPIVDLSKAIESLRYDLDLSTLRPPRECL